MSTIGDTDALFSLRGRHIVIAGGASGIGLGVATGLAQRGVEIELWDANADALRRAHSSIKETTGFSPSILEVDVTAPDEIDQAVSAAESRHPIDGLFNSVGISSARKDVLDISQDEWNRMISINLTGAWNLSRAVGKGMVQRGGGAIVHVASTNTVDPSPGIAHYCVSKAGVGMLVQSLGLEWARHGVRVNGIGPGPILTPMTEPILAGNAALRQEWERRVPMQRLGSPDDLLGAAIFLLCDASSWMTGQVIYVDGGWLL